MVRYAVYSVHQGEPTPLRYVDDYATYEEAYKAAQEMGIKAKIEPIEYDLA